MQIALFATPNRPRALTIARQVTAWLLHHGHQVRMASALAEASECPACMVVDDAVVAGADIAIAVGGDGTMLGAVRAAAPHHVPTLGINAGALGFLTELTPNNIEAYLPQVVNGEYAVEPRMMIKAHLYRNDTQVGECFALNDVVVRQGAKGRLIHLNMSVAGHHLGRFGADGLIVSTPTGSTAYGLSAGGPIVHPVTSAMILVPICPHSLSFRPMVVPAADPVEILCESNQHGDEMMVTADGQEPVTVLPGDRVIVQQAPERALLIKLDLFSFYDRLRDKLQWGGGG